MKRRAGLSSTGGRDGKRRSGFWRCKQDELERFASFLLLLRDLARSTERTPMASPGYRPVPSRRGQIERMDRVVRYLQQRVAEPVTLEEVAAVAHRHPAAFCRFFKASTGKTLVRCLHELPVSVASRLLLETDLPVTEVALESGFANLPTSTVASASRKGCVPGSPGGDALGAGAETRPLPEARRFG